MGVLRRLILAIITRHEGAILDPVVLNLTNSTHMLLVIEVVPLTQGLFIPLLRLMPLPIDTAHDREGPRAHPAVTARSIALAGLSRGLHSRAVIGVWSLLTPTLLATTAT
jgi:hypothetical protein